VTAELHFPSEHLGDDLVLLRAWDGDDVPANIMEFSDPIVQRFSWPHTVAYSEAHARSFFEEQTQARLRGEALNFALAKPDAEDVVLGGASLYSIDLSQKCAAVGYWLTSEARGRGVATHAVRLLARWAFDALGIARLELSCSPDNDASRRVAKRCGFVEEGLLRSNLRFKGGRRDSVLFSLLPGELP
jgi:RimJ/RimL family protein N-acetyltransferase